MICPTCNQRWADFPEEDYEFVDGGVNPKHDKADINRTEVFNNDEPRYCGCLDAEPEVGDNKIFDLVE